MGAASYGCSRRPALHWALQLELRRQDCPQKATGTSLCSVKAPAMERLRPLWGLGTTDNSGALGRSLQGDVELTESGHG